MNRDTILKLARQADAYADAMGVGGKNYVGLPVMWACQRCRAKFVPMQQLMDEVRAEREECAKVCSDMWERRGTDCAAAIRSRT